MVNETNLLICRNCKRIAPDSDWLQASEGELACVECFSRSVEELDEDDVRKNRIELGSLLRIGLTMLLWFSLGVAFALPWLFTNEEIAENAFTFWRAF